MPRGARLHQLRRGQTHLWTIKITYCGRDVQRTRYGGEQRGTTVLATALTEAAKRPFAQLRDRIDDVSPQLPKLTVVNRGRPRRSRQRQLRAVLTLLLGRSRVDLSRSSRGQPFEDRKSPGRLHGPDGPSDRRHAAGSRHRDLPQRWIHGLAYRGSGPAYDQSLGGLASLRQAPETDPSP